MARLYYHLCYCNRANFSGIALLQLTRIWQPLSVNKFLWSLDSLVILDNRVHLSLSKSLSVVVLKLNGVDIIGVWYLYTRLKFGFLSQLNYQFCCLFEVSSLTICCHTIDWRRLENVRFRNEPILYCWELQGKIMNSLAEFYLFKYFIFQDFILEHYSEDSSEYEDEIADLMDLRQVSWSMA